MIDISKRSEKEQRKFNAAMYLYKKYPEKVDFDWYEGALWMWYQADKNESAYHFVILDNDREEK